MAFDQAEPQDTTKIRNLGVVIRPNWKAIEEGESTFAPWAINYTSRTDLVGPPDDPAAIAGNYILYSKDDADSVAQLYGIDENSNITQFSNGATSQGNSGYTSLHGGMKLQWSFGTFGTGGSAVSPSELSAVYAAFTQIDDSSASPTVRAYVYNINSPAGSFNIRATSAGTKVWWVAIGN